MNMVRRPLQRRHGSWHPAVASVPAGTAGRRGGALQLAPLYGPAGLVGPAGATDHPYQGMDPSDPVTWVRPYRPAAGMIGYLNFDGAMPNRAQAIGR